MSYGTNSPQGLQPIGTLTGAPWTASVRTFSIGNAYATSLYNGDPIAPSAAGTVVIATIGGGASPSALGAFQGCYYTDSNNVIQKQPYWAASTATATNTLATADVITDPNTIYTIQVNGSSGLGYAALTDTFTSRNFSFATSGSTITAYSGVTLDLTASNLVTDNMKIIGLTPFPGNTWGLQYNNVNVIINNNFFRPGVAGV